MKSWRSPAAQHRNEALELGPTCQPAYLALTGGLPATPRLGVEDAQVELDEVERFYTDRDLWNRLTWRLTTAACSGCHHRPLFSSGTNRCS